MGILQGAVAYGDYLYAAWKGEPDDERIFYSRWNGNGEWEPASLVPGNTSTGPSLGVFAGSLYAAWKGEWSDPRLFLAKSSGSGWEYQGQIQNAYSDQGPALCSFSSTQLIAAWKGFDQKIYYAIYNGANWTRPSPIAGAASSVGPSLAAYDGKLYAAWKGQGSDVRLYNADFDGMTWSAQANDIPGNTGPDPEPLLQTPSGGNSNYLLADSKGAALAGATVTVIVTQDIVPDNAESYSFQINCQSPAQRSGAAPFAWQQFGFRIAGNELFSWVNCYREQDLPGNPMINWDSRSMPGNTGVVSLPNNRLPAGWQLTTTLVTDDTSTLTGFAFSIAQPDGTVLNSPILTLLSLNASVSSGNLAPALNCQAILVGENGGTTTDFSAGEGFFLLHETSDLTAGESQDESGEGSNVSYAPLPASYPNGEFYQFFSVP